MSRNSPRGNERSKLRKNRTWNLSSPQVWLPPHLSAWPDVKLPKPPASAPKPKLDRELTATDKTEKIETGHSHPSRERDRPKENENTFQGLGIVKTLSLSDDDDDADQTDNTSSEESRYDSACEGSLAKDRRGSNLVRKIDDFNDLSTGDDFALTDESDTDSESGKSDSKANGSQLTLDEGSTERKDKLKHATASQKQDKSTGKKKNKEKGGSENVFNARSPRKDSLGTPKSNDNATSIKSQTRTNANNSSVTKFFDSLTTDVLGPQAEPINALSSPHPAILHVHSSHNSPSQEVPVRLRLSSTTHDKRTVSQPTEFPRREREDSATLTEAQRQAELLQRNGHHEFSSRAFEASDEEEIEEKATKDSGLGTKKKKKKKKGEKADTKLDPVEAEIAKQQAIYRDYMDQRMQKNPEHYFKKDESRIYELTTDEESDNGERLQSNGTRVSGRG